MAENRLNARVENGFLGAVGSLYGLFQLLKREREGVPPPELVVFEYTLNDINLTGRYFITNSLVRATLSDVACYCCQNDIVLQFLCLEPKDRRAFRPMNPGRRTQRIYEETAKKHGLPAPLALEEALGRQIQDDDYLDKDHLKSEPSHLLAEKLVSRISTLEKPRSRSSSPKNPGLSNMLTRPKRQSSAPLS